MEQTAVLRFLNLRAIKQGFESEEDYFNDPLVLAQWVRDARAWATHSLKTEPHMWSAIKAERGGRTVEETRSFFSGSLFSSDPATADDIEVTSAPIEWARTMRGFEASS